MALQTATLEPERIAKLILIFPAGVVSGSAWQGPTKAAIPMARYRMAPSEKNLRRFMSHLFTTWDEDWARYMGDAFTGFALNLQVPPLATEKVLRNFKAPTLVFAAENDIQFPGEKLLKRVGQLIPHAEKELLGGSHHAPPMTDEFRISYDPISSKQNLKRLTCQVIPYSTKAVWFSSDKR